jgi:hypothetical protein
MSNDGVTWTKSTYSGDNGGCVEWATLEKRIGVRDSKDPGGPVLTFTGVSWQRFVDATRSGELNAKR